LPSGLGNSPFNLGSLLGLSPGTQCGDLVGCSLGPFGAAFVGVDEAAEVGLCAMNPIACGIVFTAAVIAYEIWLHQQTRTETQTQQSVDPECSLEKESWDPTTKWSKCYYDCSDLGLGQLCDRIPGSGCQLSISPSKLGPCE
jgi:hypothetical protein